MNRQTFNLQYATLKAAYPWVEDKKPEESEELCWQIFQPVPDDLFVEGVKAAILDCKFFPSIAELLEKTYPPILKNPPYNPYGSHEAAMRKIVVSPRMQLETAQQKFAVLQLEETSKKLITKKEKK